MSAQRMVVSGGRRLAWALATLLLLAPAGVRARQEGPDPGGGPEGPPPGDEAMREDIQETIEIYMIARMKRVLNLTDAQERVVVPLVEDLNGSRRDMNRRRRLTLMKLRPLIEDPSSSDREIGSLVAQLDEVDRQFREKEFKARDQIRAALNPRQQAQFIFFQERFRQEMEERLRRLQSGGGPGPGPARRNPPPPSWPRRPR